MATRKANVTSPAPKKKDGMRGDLAGAISIVIPMR
jgi:hypothetical protein